MKEHIFSGNSIKRLLKKEGAKAISNAAAHKMIDLIENYAKEIGKRAIKNAFYSGRKTVKEEDVEEVEN